MANQISSETENRVVTLGWVTSTLVEKGVRATQGIFVLEALWHAKEGNWSASVTIESDRGYEGVAIHSPLFRFSNQMMAQVWCEQWLATVVIPIAERLKIPESGKARE